MSLRLPSQDGAAGKYLLEYSNSGPTRQDFYKFSLNLLVHRMATRRETRELAKQDMGGVQATPDKAKIS